LTIRQGRLLSDAIRLSGRVFQTNTWQRSVGHYRLACELIRNGRIGQVHTIRTGLTRGMATDNQPAMSIPPGFDYDRWLGPAPLAPYTPLRCHYNFRYIQDYSGGKLGEFAIIPGNCGGNTEENKINFT